MHCAEYGFRRPSDRREVILQPGGRGALHGRTVRYHLTALGRFLAISLPSLLLIMALFWFGVSALGPETSAGLSVENFVRGQRFGIGMAAGGWLVEALALTALFLLIQGRAGSWWLDGLVTASIAWVFRGPLLVLSVVALGGLGSVPWWQMSQRWLVLYVICGLTLAAVARSVGLRR